MNSCTGPICSFNKEVGGDCLPSLINGALSFSSMNPSSSQFFPHAAMRTSWDVGLASYVVEIVVNGLAKGRGSCSQSSATGPRDHGTTDRENAEILKTESGPVK
jgi:hypothetical protein